MPRSHVQESGLTELLIMCPLSRPTDYVTHMRHGYTPASRVFLYLKNSCLRIICALRELTAK